MPDESAQDTMQNLAMHELAASALAKKSGGEDNAMLGNALLLLASRACRSSCSPARCAPRVARR
jgi:hypothetical protein